MRLPWPKDDAHGIGSNEGVDSNLPYRTCNGVCSNESVWFERCSVEDDGDGRVGGFCKTNFRPYDLAVMAFLIVAKHNLGGSLQVQTDGTQEHWADAFALCQDTFGYGAGSSFYQRQLVCNQEAMCG